MDAALIFLHVMAISGRRTDCSLQ